MYGASSKGLHACGLYPEVTFQVWEGFGGAITDAAGSVYAQMSQQQQNAFMDAWFGPKNMGCELVRVHMDSCDFSTEMYEAMSDPNDRELKSFSFSRTEKYIIPMLRDAQKAAGKPLKLMLSPWSPPAFMKTNGSRTHGGKLRPEYRDLWADYICRYIQEFQNRGFFVQRLSVQNEPKAMQTWDSCVFTAQEEKEFLRDHLYPALVRHGLEHIELFVWDHNKERVFERACQTIDDTTRDLIAGVAFHWYSGDHFEGLDLARRVFPGLKMVASESCIEYSLANSRDIKASAYRLTNELLGDLNHGMAAFYDWNILLDETGGPNHVGNNCAAQFMFDRAAKTLESNLLNDYFRHFSDYLMSGAVRIGISSYSASSILATAFLNPDGSVVTILFNRSQESMPVTLRMKEQLSDLQIGAGSIVTAVIHS